MIVENKQEGNNHQLGRPIKIYPSYKQLCVFFILCSPLTNIGFHPWLPISMLAALLAFFFLFLKNDLRFHKTDSFLFLLLLTLIMPWMISGEYITSKPLNHFMAFSTTIIMYFITCRSLLIKGFEENIKFIDISRFVFYALLGTSCFIFLETGARNFGWVNVDDIIPYASRAEFDIESKIGFFYQRPRGFATESGAMAFFYNSALFIAWPYVRGNLNRLVLSIAIIIPGYLMLISVGSFGAIALSCSLYFGYRSLKNLKIMAMILVFIFLIAGYFLIYPPSSDGMIGKIIFMVSNKLSLFDVSKGPVGESATDRLDKYINAWNLFKEYPFGVGWGVTAGLEPLGMKYEGIVVDRGQISLPLVFLTAGGAPAFIISFGIILYFLKKAWHLNEYRAELFLATLTTSFHHMFVSGYWYPYLWICFALILAQNHYEKNNKSWGPGN